MPGFVVNTLGAGAPSKPKAYYKYTWEVEQLFGQYQPNSGRGVNVPLWYLKDATVPAWDFELERVMGGSLQYKFAKSIVWYDIKISWYDTDGLANILRAWRALVWDPSTGLNDPGQYKQQTILTPLSYDLQSRQQWLMVNSWPQSIKSSDLTYTDSDIKSVEAVICYDWAQQNTGPATNQFSFNPIALPSNAFGQFGPQGPPPGWIRNSDGTFRPPTAAELQAAFGN